MNTLHAEEIPLPQSRQSPIGEGNGIDEIQSEQAGGAGEGSQEKSVVAEAQQHTESAQNEEAEEAFSTSASANKEHANEEKQGGNENIEVDGNDHAPNDNADTDGSPLVQTTSISSSAMRPSTPLSRTSTPPLGANAGTVGARKFSRVNVNKKFLSKGASPVVGSPASTTKLGLTSALLLQRRNCIGS